MLIPSLANFSQGCWLHIFRDGLWETHVSRVQCGRRAPAAVEGGWVGGCARQVVGFCEEHWLWLDLVCAEVKSVAVFQMYNLFFVVFLRRMRCKYVTVLRKFTTLQEILKIEITAVKVK